MKQISEILTVNEVKEIKALIRSLNTWVKNYPSDSVENIWFNQLIKQLTTITVYNDKKTIHDGEYIIYYASQYFTNVEELYRTNPKYIKRYEKLKKVWLILFESRLK